jgi:hypothetical protein
MSKASRARKLFVPDFSKPVFSNPVRHDGPAPVAGVLLVVVTLQKPREYFLSLPAYKGQRDTEDHRQDQLRSPEYDCLNPTIGHDFVVFQYTDNHGRSTGEEELIDGNTTVLMHHKGDITLPPNCSGKAFQGHGTRRDQDAQAARLYGSYNSKLAAKQASDVLFGAQTLSGFKGKSALFAGGRYTSALDFADGVRQGLDHKATTRDKLGLTGYWKREMKDVDDQLVIDYVGLKAGMAKPRTNAGLLAAFLVYLRADPERARFFIKMYYMSRGSGNTELPWIALWHQVKLETKKTGGSREVTRSVLEWTLYAISRVSDADIRRRTAEVQGSYSSTLDHWVRINMTTFWSKNVSD